MSYDGLLLHDVVIRNPDLTSTGSEDGDRYGDEELTYDVGTASKARVEQESSTEDIIDRDTRVQAFKVFLPPEATVSALSLLVWQGRDLRVMGEPLVADAAMPYHHIELRCQEVLG